VHYQLEDREQLLVAQGRAISNKPGKRDLKRYGAQVRDKIEKYKKMREEIAALRAELATLQRTEQILKGKHQHLDAFLTELERKRGVEVSLWFVEMVLL
jgi:chromosome segregation ATPase